jgi:hypothetical protein
MQHQWIFDVLDDMRSYALLNGLDGLSHQLDLAMATAAADISRASGLPVPLLPRAGSERLPGRIEGAE